MASYSSQKALESAILGRMNSAMGEAMSLMIDSTEVALQEFYSQGQPNEYVRTGALGDTTKNTSLKTSGDTISFEIYLKHDSEYPKEGMPASVILQCANEGTAGILGKPGFWETATEQMEKILPEVFGSYFD